MISVGIIVNNKEEANKITGQLTDYLNCKPRTIRSITGESEWILPLMYIKVLTKPYARGTRFDIIYYDEEIYKDEKYFNEVLRPCCLGRPQPIWRLLNSMI